MVYDSELNRGVRKKYLPEPNPQRVELPRDASLRAVFEKAKHLFFEDFEVELGAMCLADSGGVLLPIEDENNWSLSSFYTKNSLQPSRYKLYVVIGQEVSILLLSYVQAHTTLLTVQGKSMGCYCRF